MSLVVIAVFAHTTLVIRATAATPADYGFPTPLLEPKLPDGVDAFDPPLLGDANGPAIAEWTRTAGPDETAVIAGPAFATTSIFRVYGQSGAGLVTADATPLTASANGATVALPGTLPAWSMYLLWPGNGSSFGLPVALNRTEAWWVGPDDVVAGDTASVYGRNLAKNNGISTSYIYIKPFGTATGTWAMVSDVNPYRVSFIVPQLAAGSYEVWIHNGHGGHFGWSGPVPLTILMQSSFAGQSANIFNVKNYGAVGNGSTDDTTAIRNALTAAGAAAPATVYFPAGTYMINGDLNPVDNVSWVGDGRDTSIIKAGPNYGINAQYGFIFSDDSNVNTIEFKDLAFDGSSYTGDIPFFLFRHHNNIRFTNVRMTWHSGATLSNQHQMIKNSEFIGPGFFFGNARQVLLANNTFKMTDNTNAAVTSWGGKEFAVIGNTIQDLDSAAPSTSGQGRFFVSQGHWGPTSKFYFGDNMTINVAPLPITPDQNSGEIFIFETGGSAFGGTLSASTATSVTLPTLTSDYTGDQVVITKGKGVGQHRLITGYDATTTTLTVSPAWRVTPDTSSRVEVVAGQDQTVIYHNVLDGKSDYVTRQTASVGVSMYGNNYDMVLDGNTVTDTRDGLVAIFAFEGAPGGAAYFNLITNNKVSNVYSGINVISRTAPSNVGTLGHLGEVFRNNVFSNIMTTGIAVDAVNTSTSGDVDLLSFEKNSLTGVYRGVSLLMNPSNPRSYISNIVLYGNTFDRGTAPFSGLTAPAVSPGATLFDSGNLWLNFDTSTFERLTETIWGNITPISVKSDSIDYELGTIFTPAVDGTITGVRFYIASGESGVHTARIWNNMTNTVIGGPYTFTPSGTGWSECTLRTPISVTAGTAYTISISTGSDSGKAYAYQQDMLMTAGSNGAHLLYLVNAAVFSQTLGTRPTRSYRWTNYFRDICFTSAQAPDTQTPSVPTNVVFCQPSIDG